jgi:pyrroloquinoline quinone biosynthesis protein B
MKNLLFLACFLFSFILKGQEPYIFILGTAQDGGYPQAACQKACCDKVWSRKAGKINVSSIAIVDPASKEQWIIDATPDFKEQLHLLNKQSGIQNLSGIMLTHAHIGHYTGLMHLGREVMGASKTKVFAMPKMRTYLSTNGPWSQLVSLQNIVFEDLENKTLIKLNDRISIIPFTVPHRDEFSETVGYQVIYKTKKIIFIPDIDKWEKWETPLIDLVNENDVLLLDGTFYKDGEIARPMKEVPHPFVTETMDLLKKLPKHEKNKVHFIHLNHTNPLLDLNSIEYKTTLKNGFKVSQQSQKIKF